jgi:hypothetical protein
MRVLIISRSFPPLTNTRSIQMWKLVNALADQGVEVVVLAGYQMSQEYKEENDKYLFASNHYLKIHYIPSKIYVAKKYTLKERINEKAYSEISSLGITSWVREAKIYAEMLVKIYSPDLILSNSTPFESHIVGYHIRKTKRLPWIISLSDPLIHRSLPYPYNNEQLIILSYYRKLIYKKVLNSSDIIHMYSKYGFLLIEKFIDSNNANRFFTIPHIGGKYTINGNNEELIYKDKLVFVGHLKKERIPKYLIDGINQASSDLSGLFKGIICVGKVSNEFKKLVKKYEFEKQCKIIDNVPHNEAMKIMKHSGALLVLDEFVNEISPILVSKIGEYAMSGRPILGITPRISALRDYLKNYGGGIAVDDDKVEIITAIKELFSENSNMYSNNLAKNFYPENIAKEYIRMFETAISIHR